MVVILLLSLIYLIYTKSPNNIPLNTTFRLYGNITFGYYYFNLYLGKPPQIQSFIVDTGSNIMTIPCEQCIECSQNHLYQIFNKQKSTTSKKLNCSEQNIHICQSCQKQNPNCNFMIDFAEGSSLSGFYFQQTFTFENLQSNYTSESQYFNNKQARVVLGCTVNQSQLFKKQKVNGILGLSPYRNTNFIEIIYENNKHLDSSKFGFSLCLSRNGGYMSIGQMNNFIHKSDIPKIINYYTFQDNLYGFPIEQLKFGNQILTKIKLQTIIDSGSTYTYFPSQIYNKMLYKIFQICDTIDCKRQKNNQQKCFTINGIARQNFTKYFPSLYFTFSNKIIIQWTAFQYFIKSPYDINTYCLGFQQLQSSILGATWLFSKDVYFDLKQKTINIYQSDCRFPGQPQIPQHMYDQNQRSLRTIRRFNWKKFAIMIGIFGLLLMIWSFFRPGEKQKVKQQNKNINLQQKDKKQKK